ncbi:MAG: tryptophan synthase subunit alpha [Desulfobacteraceae bacterium]|jgi:tryptophan synthase alpha chain
MINNTINATEQENSISACLLTARAENRLGIIPFINCGDPDLQTTHSLLSACDHSGVCAVELGVPFANSITDGPKILKSHERALAQKTQFEDVIDLVRDFRQESSLPIYILAEYRHTVHQRGITAVLTQAKSAGANGFLMHCLPPLLLRSYLDTAREVGLATVLGLFPNSKPNQIEFVMNETTGFIYLTSSYGKTGTASGLTPNSLSFFKQIRDQAKQPLAVGFGLKTRTDLKTIFNSGVDAGIVGSSITAIIEQHLDDATAMCAAVTHYLTEMQI